MPGSPAGGHHRAVPRQRAAPTAVPAAHAPRASAADARVPHLCRRAGEWMTGPGTGHLSFTSTREWMTGPGTGHLSFTSTREWMTGPGTGHLSFTSTREWVTGPGTGREWMTGPGTGHLSSRPRVSG